MDGKQMKRHRWEWWVMGGQGQVSARRLHLAISRSRERLRLEAESQEPFLCCLLSCPPAPVTHTFHLHSHIPVHVVRG